MGIISVVLTRAAMLPIFILLLCVPARALPLTFGKLLLPNGVTGPACLAFDSSGGGPFVGVQDGRILKYQGPSVGFVDFSIVSRTRSKVVCDGLTNDDLGPACGRPFGLDLNLVTSQLYITDAYFGLLVVGPNGGLATPIASGVNGVPFNFLSSVAVDPLTGGS